MYSVNFEYYMQPQNPTGVFTFNNFVGYMKSILLYQSLYSFPIITPLLEQTITTTDCLIYYKFDLLDWRGPKVLDSLAFNPSFG